MVRKTLQDTVSTTFLDASHSPYSLPQAHILLYTQRQLIALLQDICVTHYLGSLEVSSEVSAGPRGPSQQPQRWAQFSISVPQCLFFPIGPETECIYWCICSLSSLQKDPRWPGALFLFSDSPPGPRSVPSTYGQIREEKHWTK